ncbi:MAG: ribbon-helix-helix domain-containing protein [Methanomassiliicoccaceae archaeon]|nr:ribbon-helix-helix domain-containing protein [Methanomassiliicoccaceae archaeon]
MDDERITLRMGPSDVQVMDDYLEEHPELGTRSQFIRTALREYMKRDATCISVSDKKEAGLYVRFNPVELAALNVIKERGMCLNEEEFVRMCVTEKIIPKATPEEFADIFKTAQQMKL